MRDVLEITVEWSGTVIDVHHLGAGEQFTLDAETAYGGIDDLLPPGGLTLAQVGEAGFRVVVPVGATGAHWGEAASELSAEQAQAIALTPGARVCCVFGPLTFYFARVPAAVRPARRTFAGVLGDVKSFASAALLHAAVVIVALAVPPTKQALSIDRFMGDDRFVDVIMTPSDPVEPVSQTGEPSDTDEDGGAEAPAVDAPNEAGGVDSPEPMTRPAPLTPTERKAHAKATASAIGEALDQALDGGDFLGGADPLGQQASSALAGLNGRPQGEGAGLGGGDSLFGGVGIAGTGGGPQGSLRTGKVQAKCTECRTVKTAFGRKQPKKMKRPKIIPLEPNVADGLTREEVQRVIRRMRAQYRACYDKALQTHRGLEGKVRISFMVKPDGSVLLPKVQENTMGTPEVANCIARRMKTWHFPKPRGGGIVTVRYPFLFRAPDA